MKKTKVILGALLALAMTACEKDEGLKLQNNEFSITATRESNEDKGADTRATISEAKLKWSANESITVWNGSKFTDLKTQEGGETATFTGEEITPTSYAVYPHNLKPTFDGTSTVKVTLPDTYEGITDEKEGYKSGEAYPPMLATIATAGATSLYFENLGGLVMFNVTGLPLKYTQFVFKTTNDMPITGEFAVEPSDGKNVIKSATATGTTANTVTFKFKNTAATNNMVFYVPLPVAVSDGSVTDPKYEFTIDFLDSEGNTLFTTPKKGWVKIERSKYTKLDLALGSTTGGAEEGTEKVTVSSAVNGEYALPSTGGTVEVTMEANSNPVTLKYSSEGTHPSKVNINCTGNITGLLTVNLADSHVEVKKASTVTETNITINALSSTTSTTSLVLDSSVKIEEKLTVAKGSAEIKGTVKNVEVKAKESGDTSTDEVTIKVANGATVEETLSVGQGNVEIAGKVATVEVKSTVGTEATVKVASTANITNKLDVATGSVEVAGKVKEVAVAASVSNVTIAAAVETVTVAAVTTGESSDAAPVVWVADGGTVSTLTNNNSNAAVVTTNATTQITSSNGSNTKVQTAAEYMADKIKNGGTVTLEDNISGNFTIESGVAVINLNGKKISNKADGDAAVITVSSGATLTINGTGEITHGADGKYVIDNKGTLNINGGTYTGQDVLINNAGTLNIKGGTYTPVSGKNIIYNAGTLSVDAGIDLTPVGNKNIITAYVANETSLNAAIANTDIKEIVLNDDIALTAKSVINGARNVVIDMNGRTVSTNSDAAFDIYNATVEFTGTGTVSGATNAAMYARGNNTDTQNYTVLTLGSGITLKSINDGILLANNATSDSNRAINYGVVINCKATIIGGNSGINVNGLNKITTGYIPQINIDGANISSDEAGIYAAGYAEWNIQNATIAGKKTAIEIRAGKMTIGSGTFTSTADPLKVQPNGNGSTTEGAALAVSQHTTNLPINVTINGGTFNGVYSIWEKDVQNEVARDQIKLTVTDGIFNGAIYSQNNTSFISKGTFSDMSGVNYVANNGTYKLNKSVTLSDKLVISSGNTFKIDLNGKTLTGRTNLTHGKVTFENGTIAGGKEQALNVYGSTDATAKDYSYLVVDKSVKVTADVWGVCVFGNSYTTNGYGAVADIYGTVETTGDGKEGAVFVSGNLGKNVDAGFAASATNIVNIYGSVTSQKDAAVALNGAATVTVYTGATITGNTAIAVKRGKLIVNGGTIIGNGEEITDPAANGNGTEMTGAAVSATGTYSKLGPLSVEITNGTFTSAACTILNNSDYEFQISGGEFTTTATDGVTIFARLGSINITGGSFTNNSNSEGTMQVGCKSAPELNKSPKLTISGNKTVVKNEATGPYKWNNAYAPLTINMANQLTYKAVNISGGTFYGQNPSQDDNIKTDIGNFLATGYKVTETSTNVWQVVKDE